MKVLITGGSGFFGKYLASELASKNNVILYDVKKPSYDYKKNKKITYSSGDILDAKCLRENIRNADAVFHLASVIPPIKSDKICNLVNVEGTKILLNEALKHKKRIKIIHISSSAVYGIPLEIPITEETKHNPLGTYAISKEGQENLCYGYRKKGLVINIMRPRTIIGEGMSSIFNKVFYFIHNNLPVPVLGDGGNLVQHISGKDFAVACSLALNRVNKEFNIGAEKFSTINKDILGLIDAVKSKSRLMHINSKLVKNIFSGFDLIGLSPLDKNQYLTYDLDYYFDISNAKKNLHFKPKYNNVDMLVEAYKWYVANR